MTRWIKARAVASDADFEHLIRLLPRFCEAELDQWEAWRTSTRSGDVYVLITREPVEGSSPEFYDEIVLPDQAT